MSDNINDGMKRNNAKPLVEHPVDVSGSMEGSSSGKPSTAERPVKDASNQTESSRVLALRDKWEEVGKKTYAEMASALPGGAERHTNQKHVHSSQVPTPEHQPSDQHFQGLVNNPLQHNPEQGLQSSNEDPRSSNQGCLCQGSNPPAPAEYDSNEQQGSARHGHFEVMLRVIAIKFTVIHCVQYIIAHLSLYSNPQI